MKAGITGHQNLESGATLDWLRSQLLNELNNLVIDEAYSSLAIGADQLFARLILKLNIPLVVIIPCNNYQQTFDNVNLKEYISLLEKSYRRIQLEFNTPSELAFYEAGKKIADYSEILFAIWDNGPANGLGGTADIVDYAIEKNKEIIHLNPITKTINIINHGK